MIRCHFITMLVLAGAAAVSHASNFTITSSTSGSSARFIVTRDDTTAAETVNYRTVSISAYAGQHYTAKSGTLTFPAGQSAVTNTVTETTPTADAYKFQTDTSRYYRFEITDAGGFLVTNATRSLTTGTRVTASDAFGEKDLPINAGTITVTDGGYDQAYHSVTVNNYFTAAAPKDYLVAAGAQLRATVTFHAREKDDGYQYVAIYANTSTSNVDTGAKDGDPGTVSYSRYMAGFTIDGNVSSTWYPYTFPLTSKGHDCGEQTHPWSGNSNGNLKQQYFKSNCRAADGRLIIPTDLSSLYVRLNASGNLNDTWYASNVVAHVQAVDATVPTVLDVSAAPGIHARGNEFYVSVAFSEPVTCSSATLTNTWGTLTYNSGNGSNVLTFKGTIPADATDPLNVTGKIGTIKDLAGNALTGSVSANNLANLDASHAYAIAYDLAGGTLPSGRSNPYTYIYEDQRILLANPLRPCYTFAGWTGTGISGLTNAVNIYRSHGDLAYVANWTPITYSVHFDPGAVDATGPMPDQSFTYDAPQALSSNAFTRAGYAFAGWRGADGAIHPDRATVLNLTNAQDAVVSLTAQWRPNIPYIDADGTERFCTDYTVITNAAGNDTYGTNGTENWYVVTNAVTISGNLWFYASTAHLILCDGATLAVTNANGYAIRAGNLTIYGQTNGTGTVTANGGGTGGRGIFAGGSVTINGGTVTANGGNRGISASGDVTINGGTVTATGRFGIFADHAVTINGGTVTANGDTDGIYAHGSVEINGGTVTAEGGGNGIRADSIILGWTNPTDSITASSYNRAVRIDKALTDGTAIYKGNSVSGFALAGVTLVPAYSIELPEGIVASGVVTQIVNTAYALPDANVTLSAATPGYAIGDVTVNGVPLADGTCSFAASDAAVTIAVTMTPITYTVRFDAGGGEGPMPDQSFTYDAPQAIASNAFARANHAFTGWRGADGAIYADGATVLNLTNAQDAVVSLVAQWGIPYIDADGTERICTDYTVLTNAEGYVEYGGGSGWYVVTNSVTISGQLHFNDSTAHLILCDGATLAVTNENGDAIDGGNALTIYGQTNGTGSVTAEGGGSNGIAAQGSVTINGGTVTAEGGSFGIYSGGLGSVTINGGTVTANGTGYGIFANGSVTINGGTVTAEGGGNGIRAGSIILGWTNPTDSITASSYGGNVSVKDGQRLTDGSAIYQNTVDPAEIAGKTLRPHFVPYIDADGVERICTDFTVLTNATGGVTYGANGEESWYVVTNAVTISGKLNFSGTAHLILCDGATLAVTNANGSAIQAGDLAIYGQTNGTGTVTANGTNGAGISAADFSVTINGGTVTAIGGTGINAHYSVTINGGTVTATGRQYGIFAEIGSITLGWTNPTDSITASSYYAVDGVSVKDGQRLTDGSDIYQDMVDPAEIAGMTLRPAYSISLPEGVVAGGVIRQDGTTAYAIAGTNVTLSAATPGYAIGTVTVNGVPLADGTCSFAASADVTIAATMTPVTYVVRFDAGGGEGSMPDQSFTYGAPQALTSNAFTRAGYTFAGWLGADGAIYPDGADVDRLYVRYIVRYADNKEDTWKRFDRMPYPGKTNDDYHLGDGALQNTENDNGLNLYTGFENSDWDPDDPYTAAIISQNAAWFDEHDARNGVSMKLIEDFPNFYKEPVVVAQDGVVTLVAQWGIPYIDADGAERTCTDFTVLTNATGDVRYGGGSGWYVVTNAVTISGWLGFSDAAHLILCDGATLAVTNANDSAIIARPVLTIYGQTNGTGAVTATGGTGIDVGYAVTINGGTVTATGGQHGIYTVNGSVTINGGTVTATGTNGNGIDAERGSVTINGGTVTATGRQYGIYANNFITLGWTNPTDSITASRYRGNVSVKAGQALTDGSNIYGSDYNLGATPSAIAGVTLRPYIDTPTYPAYLGLPADPDDYTDEDFDIRANYDAWAQRYGYDALGANETAYLLDVAPWAVTNGVAPLKVAEMGVTNILVGEAGDFGWVAQRMGYTGDTLPIWRLVLASDVAPLKDVFYDSIMVCNGYLVLRIGTDLSVPKSEWLETGWFARVEDGRAELLCPEFLLEKYRERVARETGKPCPGLFLSVSLSPRQSSSTAFSEILQEEIGDYLP